jgi:YggT family protein
MNPFLELFLTVIDIYKFILIVWIVLSWLISFNIVNRYQPFVSRLYQFLEQLTDPVLKYLRKYVPLIGSVDITPVILFIVLNFAKNLLIYYVF